jgi:hypothetical protein
VRVERVSVLLVLEIGVCLTRAIESLECAHFHGVLSIASRISCRLQLLLWNAWSVEGQENRLDDSRVLTEQFSV